MARVLRATAPHFVLPSAVHPSCFSVCGMRATFSRPTWHKGQLVLRVADFQAGRVARSHDLLPETPWRVTKVHPSEDVIEHDGGRRGGRIRQASRRNGVACGAGLTADEGRVCHTVAVKNARPAQRILRKVRSSTLVDGGGQRPLRFVCSMRRRYTTVPANPQTRYHSRRVLLCVLSVSITRGATEACLCVILLVQVSCYAICVVRGNHDYVRPFDTVIISRRPCY
ncbi:hypothetical protein EDB89DRAFT_399448 [Lactarius sanguifluus]|nr:hypothetical protein EDB89DRAFT_399448 [Lactarius sanguifluus]